MVRRATIGVDDDLASGQSRIRGRTAKYERAGRVHQHTVFIVRHAIGKHVVKHRANHMFSQLFLEPSLIHFGIMLRGDQHGIETDRTIVVVIFDGHLSFAVRSQVRHFTALAHFGQTMGQAVGQIDRQRHEHVGLIAGVAEHHALVAGSLRLIALFAGGRGLLLTVETCHTLVDFGALLGQGDHHAAGVGIEADPGTGVTDVPDHGTHDVLDVAISLAGHLAEHEELSGGSAGFHGHMRLRILTQHIVENRIGNLIADLVRMSFRHRFGGNQLQFSHAGCSFPRAVIPTPPGCLLS